MDFQPILNLMIALGIVLALTQKLAQIGLLISCVSFTAQAAFSYFANNDLLLCIASSVAALGLFYELIKYRYTKSYHLTTRTRLTISLVLVVLGIWHTTLGNVSPYLAAGIIASALVLLERK